MIVPFTYEEVKKSVLEKLKDRGYITEEGSNIGIFSDIIAYTAFTTNLNSSFSKQESMIASATQERNIIATAKGMGYIPRGTSSYCYELTLAEGSVSNFGDIYESDGKKYVYMGELTNDTKIKVYEGELVTGKITHNKPLSYIELPHTELDENTIMVYVNGVQWQKSKSLLLESLDGDELGQFVMLNYPDPELNTTRIYFYLASLGRTVPSGYQIQYFALKSKGAGGKTETPNEFKGVNEVKSVILFNIGSDAEKIEDIKTNAPLVYNTANRLVTKNDYISVLKTFPEILIPYAWGGEDELISLDPETKVGTYDLGTAYICLIPITAPLWDFDDNFTLKNKTSFIPYIYNYTEDSRIASTINEMKVVTLQTVHRQVVFLDLDIRVKVIQYGIGINKADLNKKIFETIKLWFQQNITKYESSFYLSHLIEQVNEVVSDSGTGVIVNVTYKVPLYKSNIDTKTGNLKFTLLPSIRSQALFSLDTENFGGTTDTLSMADKEETQYVTEKYITLASENIGTLLYEKTKDRACKISLDCDTEGRIGGKIQLSDETPVYINLKYEDDSFRTTKNTLIRLVGVTFE